MASSRDTERREGEERRRTRRRGNNIGDSTRWRWRKRSCHHLATLELRRSSELPYA